MFTAANRTCYSDRLLPHRADSRLFIHTENARFRWTYYSHYCCLTAAGPDYCRDVSRTRLHQQGIYKLILFWFMAETSQHSRPPVLHNTYTAAFFYCQLAKAVTSAVFWVLKHNKHRRNKMTTNNHVEFNKWYTTVTYSNLRSKTTVFALIFRFCLTEIGWRLQTHCGRI